MGMIGVERKKKEEGRQREREIKCLRGLDLMANPNPNPSRFQVVWVRYTTLHG